MSFSKLRSRGGRHFFLGRPNCLRHTKRKRVSENGVLGVLAAAMEDANRAMLDQTTSITEGPLQGKKPNKQRAAFFDA